MHFYLVIVAAKVKVVSGVEKHVFSHTLLHFSMFSRTSMKKIFFSQFLKLISQFLKLISQLLILLYIKVLEGPKFKNGVIFAIRAPVHRENLENPVFSRFSRIF